MIHIDKTGTGDLVVVEEAFLDYGKVGDVYRILANCIPKEPTSALGWKVDMTNGVVDVSQAFKLPHDKIASYPRKKAASVLAKALKAAEIKKSVADREYKLIKSRIDGFMSYDTKEDEARSLMEKTFYFL